jgi:hypothetical protein
MYLLSNAFHAGPLAATQPGLTLVDPLVASLLGITVFGEHLSTNPSHLFGEAVAAAALLGSVILLGRSPLIQTPGLGEAPVVGSGSVPGSTGTPDQADPSRGPGEAGETRSGRRLGPRQAI